jgi:hypothetical protein
MKERKWQTDDCPIRRFSGEMRETYVLHSGCLHRDQKEKKEFIVTAVKTSNLTTENKIEISNF